MPDPLHPAIVHFPIVLATLLPISAIAVLLAMRGGRVSRRLWLIPVVLAAVLAGSAWLAVRTGEAQESRVEHVVGEDVLHAHEEAGERFLVLVGALALVMAVGLAGGALGTAGRLVSTVGAVALAAVALQVGASGGELVYRHGAASAYGSALPDRQPDGHVVAEPAARNRDDD